jgi:hypothetical protein
MSKLSHITEPRNTKLRCTTAPHRAVKNQVIWLIEQQLNRKFNDWIFIQNLEEWRSTASFNLLNTFHNIVIKAGRLVGTGLCVYFLQRKISRLYYQRLCFFFIVVIFNDKMYVLCRYLLRNDPAVICRHGEYARSTWFPYSYS